MTTLISFKKNHKIFDVRARYWAEPDEVGKDTSWLVTWECPLRTDSASWKSLGSFVQLIPFYNSCILPISSKIVSWSSTNLLLAMVSKVELWNFFNSSISLRLLSNDCSWRNWWSCRSRSSPGGTMKFLLAATRSFHLIFEYFYSHNQPGLRVF